MAVLRQPIYKDFAPVPASGRLDQRHECRASRETRRQWMTAAGLRRARSRGDQPEHPLRDKRAQRGDLAEIDGAPHNGFEGRGPARTLIVFVDDAAGALPALRFAPAETAQAYMEALEEYLGRCGRPASPYSDKHSVFRVNRPDCEGEPAWFARTLKTLDIEAVHANTPYAKGGAERANRTLSGPHGQTHAVGRRQQHGGGQRLVARLHGRAQRALRCRAGRPKGRLPPAPYDPETPASILCPHHERALSRDLTFRLRHRQCQVQTPGKGCGLRGAMVAGCEGWDDNITVIYRGKVRPVRLLAAGEPPIPPADRKTVSHRVDQAKAEQAKRPRWKSAPDHPWRRYKNRKTRPGSATLQGAAGDDILTLEIGKF